MNSTHFPKKSAWAVPIFCGTGSIEIAVFVLWLIFSYFAQNEHCSFWKINHDFNHENRHSGTGYIETAVFVPYWFQSRFQSRFSAQWNTPFTAYSFLRAQNALRCRHGLWCPLIPRLHDTTGCQTGCTTGLTTVLNEQPLFVQLFVQPVVTPGCTTGLTIGCIHDTTGCQTGLTTG